MEEDIGKLTEKQQEFVRTVELIDLGRFMNSFIWNGLGRPPSNRQSIFKAFIAKSVYNCPTTKVLIEILKSSSSLRRLCGWEYHKQIPSESTFGRAFESFAKADVPTRLKLGSKGKTMQWKGYKLHIDTVWRYSS